VFFVRHGTHDLLGRMLCGRMPGLALNRAGEEQAERVAGRLARERIAAVYASPLERARETAAPIARAFGLETRIAEALNEIDFGDWTGVPFRDLEHDPQWHRWNEARGRHCPPNGETMQQAQSRVVVWLSAVVERHPDAAIVAVCHADVVKAALAHVLRFSLDHLHRVEVSPGSLSVIDAGERGALVRSVNEVPV
jgi:probable phosphoglycerate mutase